MPVRSITGRLVLMGAALLGVGLLVPGLASGATTTAQWGDFSRSGIAFNALYPGTVTVSKGDKVTFNIVGFHTVTLLGRGQKLPPLIAASTALNPATNDPAGQPYWWGGTTPLQQLNGQALGPAGGKAFTGARTVSSGAPQGNAPKFTVTFPKKGTFQVRCIVHPNMTGTVRVVEDSSDTPKKQKARAATEKASQTTTVNSLVAKANKATGPTVAISPGNKKAQLFAFVPSNRKVPVGSTVTFTMSGGNEVHTVTFGPGAFVQALAKTTFQGSGLDLAGEGFYPSNPPAAGVPAETTTSHGNGFLNSGVLADKGVAPAPRSFQVTFPQAGAFQYICLVHPEMKGTITVG